MAHKFTLRQSYSDSHVEWLESLQPIHQFRQPQGEFGKDDDKGQDHDLDDDEGDHAAIDMADGDCLRRRGSN